MGTVTRLPHRGRQGMTVTDAVDKYHEYVRNHKSKRTYDAYGLTLQKLIDEFGDQEVAGLNPDAVAEWFTGRWGNGSAKGWNANRSAPHLACRVVAGPAGHPVDSDRSAGSAGARSRRTGPGRWTGPLSSG